MLAFLGATGDVLLVLLGFSFIVLVHELGHFVAARWAGVRVEAFAMGFGPAVVSFRKGMGLRRGSTEPEYRKLLETAPEKARAMSPTEYRFNWLFFGGYVRMLGQDDMAPGKGVEHPESYTSKPVWKRMIIISAGVVMNVVLAAVLFLVVFMVGLKTEPAWIGDVERGSPASEAEVLAGWSEDDPGLKPGDRVLRVAGHEPSDFGDFALEIAMSKKGEPVEMVVEREGAATPVTLRVTPRVGSATGLLEIGVYPAQGTVLFGAPGEPKSNIDVVATALRGAGLAQVSPGSTLVSVNDEPLSSAQQIDTWMRDADGSSLRMVWMSPSGERVEAATPPDAELEHADVVLPGVGKAPERAMRVPHLLGLTPGLRVEDAGDSKRYGLQSGDVFARVGGVEWPDLPAGIAEVRRHTGREIALRMLRDGAFVDLTAKVSREGTIGFRPGETSAQMALITGSIERSGGSMERGPSAASRLDLPPGSVILEAAGEPISSFGDLRGALVAAPRSSDGGAEIELTARLPLGGAWGAGPVETVRWSLTKDELERIEKLGWSFPIPTAAFRPEETILKAEIPAAALVMGVERTHRVMLKTYLTLVRLFQGSVKVEHLKGPVGIAHLGALVADRGFIHLLFFMGLISVNLAVVNFLPLPIVDGGHFVFLLIEQVTGRPVSPSVQGAAGLVGLALIVMMFLVVTYNDIMGLFGG